MQLYGDLKNNFILSQPQHQREKNGQVHATAALSPDQYPPVGTD